VVGGASGEQLGRDKQKGALGLNATEVEKATNELRRQAGWGSDVNGRTPAYPNQVDIPVGELRGIPDQNAALKKAGEDLPKPGKDVKDAPEPAAMPEGPKQRLKHGEPVVSTLAVAVDDLDLKATLAGGEEGKEQRPATLHPGLQDVRKIIRTAEVALEVDSYDATYAKLSELVKAEKGLVSSANTQKAANGKMQATVILRVPPDRFEPVLARLKDLGTIRSQNVDSEDVTKAYVDLETRRKSKEILAERLSKLLAEGKGTVKDLMEVEVQLGATNEAIEQFKGEIKYYDNRIALSSLTLQISEKDFGQPFEIVQTLQANLALTVRDPDDAYVKAQKEIMDAGGQVVDSRMNRQSDGSSTGTIRGRVDADKFQALRESLKKLGMATNDTVIQQKTAHGGREGLPKTDAPLRKEQAVVDLNVSSPPIFVTRRSQLVVETGDVDGAYQNSRKSVEGSGGKIVDGSLTGRGDRMVAVLRIQADADRFAALLESLKAAGKIKSAAVSSVLPTAAADGGAPLLRERAEIEFTLASPPQLIGEENGLLKTIRDTFAGSWAGLLWSVEKLFVGISLAGPWLILLALGIVFWRRRGKKSPSAGP
jgi:glycine cleavage system regulatory protein